MTLTELTEPDIALPAEVEELLIQIENSTTHYEALGIARSATHNQVKLAHQQALDLLESSRQAFSAFGSGPTAGHADAASADDPQERTNRALDHVSQAFLVLSNTKDRVAYDRSAAGRTPGRKYAPGPAPYEYEDLTDTCTASVEAGGDTSKPAAHAAVASKHRKILVADDDYPLRKVLGKILSSAGYEVILVEDGLAALEKAKTERPDLVITDGLMPKMHGFLVCKAIKELQSPPKVIMLTAVYTKTQYKWEARAKYGADELLTKPFEVAELLDCIERHLAASPEAEPAGARAFMPGD